MPNFIHNFAPASGSALGDIANLATKAIEDAGLLEILQSPGPAVGPWSLFAPLLDATSSEFRFAEPLGQSREVKTALSGLFGRFVARAYAKQHLGFTHFTHIGQTPMRLSGPMGGELRRVPGRRGDMPDWVAWSPQHGMAIIEAKGCHSRSGPSQTLQRAYAQAARAEIRGKHGIAPFKRYAIATRWGFAAPLDWEPMLWVQDPDEEGDSLPPEHVNALEIGVIRIHYARLLDRLGHRHLAAALRDLAATPFKNRQARAQESALLALSSAVARRVRSSRTGATGDELIGNFVTRGGVLPSNDLSQDDRELLSRFNLQPTFVGFERSVLKLAIFGDLASIKQHYGAPSSPDGEAGTSRDIGMDAWVVRLDEDGPQIQ